MTNGRTWTGTDPDGTFAASFCNNWTSGGQSLYGDTGYNPYTNGIWTHSTAFICSTIKRLYCFQTNAKPTPTPTPRPSPTPTPTSRPTPRPTPSSSPPLPGCSCSATLTPVSGNLPLGTSMSFTATALVFGNKCSMTKVTFSSLPGNIISAIPTVDLTSPYTTKATGIAKGNTNLSAVVTLSDGNLCSKSARITVY